MLIEQQVGILSIKLGFISSTVIIIMPIVPFHASRVMAVHQWPEVIHNSKKFIFPAWYFFELLQGDGSGYFFSINNVPISTVSSMVKPFQMNN